MECLFNIVVKQNYCFFMIFEVSKFKPIIYIREAAKKSSVLSVPAARLLDFGLVVIGTFFLTLKKVLFSLAWHTRLAPPPLSGPATKKRTVFAASLNR